MIMEKNKMDKKHSPRHWCKIHKHLNAIANARIHLKIAVVNAVMQ